MILWINGAFGAGKTTTAFELHRRIPGSFVYDPENAGYFIRRNAPSHFLLGDFQDIPLWRKTNYEMLKLIADQYDGLIIVPMTLVNREYYDEIVTKLIDDGIDVRHFILYANKETLKKRLKRRSIGKPDIFALNSIDRCLEAFDTVITDEKIITDNKCVDDVLAEIAEKADIALIPDKRPAVKKLIDRYVTLIKHIR
ncbi:MAG: AAA family ATPase [Oscillospiraceae bacterium]|nr:AAA family ATPase [Oscillospiraceae bacterium]